MQKLLDTNIVSYWMRGDEAVIDKLKDHRPCDLLLSVITVAEILYGIEKSPHKKKERHNKISLILSQIETVPFDRDAANHYGQIRCHLEKKGTPISERDLQIASIAVSNNYCLVTHNTSEFSRIENLVIEDWYKT